MLTCMVKEKKSNFDELLASAQEALNEVNDCLSSGKVIRIGMLDDAITKDELISFKSFLDEIVVSKKCKIEIGDLEFYRSSIPYSVKVYFSRFDRAISRI